MIPLDRAGLHVLVRRDAGFAVEHRGDTVSAAESALTSALRVRGSSISLALEDGSLLEVAEVAEGRLESRYLLSPFELRYAADHGRLHPVPLAARTRAPIATPITDLHTHYAGCVSGSDLLAIGREHGIAYPAALLAEAGVRLGASGPVPIAELPAGAADRLAGALGVPPTKRITFVDMERIYRLRGPITKSPATMPAILRRLASDYAAMGVRYVELSLGSLVEARVLRTIHEHVPAIEDETGVTLRLLLALSRHDDPEWDEDLLRRLAMVGESLYVAGIDVMGHETNSTHAFVPQLRAAATWATKDRPGFVIRVHAGESPSHPENLRVAIEALAGFAVATRLGHGLYGVDDETLGLVVASRATVEMNLDSNVALNHLANGRDAPIRRYLDAGVRLTLGSDGYGIYGSTAESAARAALVSGARPTDLAGPMRATEEEIIAAARERDRPARRSFAVPDDVAPVAYTDEVVARRRAAVVARDRALVEHVGALGISLLDRPALDALVAGRDVASIAGAWRHSWDAMTAEERALFERELGVFVDALDPARTVLVTGGTRFGVEGVVGVRAKARGIVVVGAIVSETAPESLSADAMSHAHVVATTLYEKCARLYELVDAFGGACVFAGGGQIVRDEIQAAKNLGVPYVALEGPGASGAHARERPSAGVRTGAEIAYWLRTRQRGLRIAPHWFEGPNPTVDAVVLRGGGRAERALSHDVLLIRRSPDAPVEPGAWALPGGYVMTDAPRGTEWRPGRETAVEACVRELREETALVVAPERLREIGVFEGNGRDPRDDARAFSRSTAFLVELEDAEARAAVAGGDDAEDARWFPLDALPPRLAFDHCAILEVALRAQAPS